MTLVDSSFHLNLTVLLMPATSPTSVVLSTTSDMEAQTLDTRNPRSCILQVGVSAGRLCGVANSHLPESKGTALVLALTELLVDLWRTSESLQLNLIQCIQNKLELNAKKYPVELCKGRSGKYTQYSHITGITKTNQTTSTNQYDYTPLSLFDLTTALPELAKEIDDFSRAREWNRFHTPRNLVLALLGEVGELAELVHWMGDDDFDPSKDKLDKLSQELADVSIYLLRVATVCDVVDPLCEALL